MAYAQGTVTKTRVRVGQRNYLIVSFAETGTTTSSEWSVQLDSRLYRLLSYKATLTSGSGATINPALGAATSWTASTQNDLGLNASTAAHINDQTELILPLAAGMVLYGQSGPDSGSDNAISTELVLLEGAIG